MALLAAAADSAALVLAVLAWWVGKPTPPCLAVPLRVSTAVTSVAAASVAVVMGRRLATGAVDGDVFGLLQTCSFFFLSKRA